MHRSLLLLPLLCGFAQAQHTLLMIADDERTNALDAPELDFMRDDEVYSVTPLPGFNYTARPFLPMSLAWYYAGDQDGDAQYVDSSSTGPAVAMDALFIKAGTVAPVTPRDVFFSTSSTSSLALPITTSDVVRYAAQGVLETFITEAQLEVATGGASLNLDAICQSAAGDIFVSFSLTETLSVGSVEDGGVVMIPASAITYDASGNVSAVTADSIVYVASEDDMIAFAAASGYKTSVGGTVTTSFELSGLEMDPNGGTFISPVDGLTVVPNLLFCWSDFSNDGAIISTAAGGSIANINGVDLASTVATQGTQIGWQPDTTGTDGPEGIALIPLIEDPYEVLNFPRNLHTQGDGQTYLQIQISGGAPFGASVIALSVESAVAGGAFPAIPAPAPFLGTFGMTAPIILGFYLHDAIGNCTSEGLLLETVPLSGAQISVQALDIGSFRLSTPGALSFL